MTAAVPGIASPLACWYGGASEHLWRDASGHFVEVPSTRGFNQGCPLAAGAFAIGIRSALDEFLIQLQQRDAAAKMYCYLDDMYLVVNPEVAAVAIRGLCQALEPLGLELNASKTAIWSPAGPANIPQELLTNYKSTLDVLGAKMRSPGDAQDAPAVLGQADGALACATDRLKKLWDRLRPLLQAGLRRQAAGALLRAYAGPASQHALQIAPANDIEVQEYDAVLKGIWETLADRPLDNAACQRLGLPAKLGGAGVQWAEDRRHAAFWSAWTAVANEIKEDLRLSTLTDLLDALPVAAQHLASARLGLAAQNAITAQDVALADPLGSHFRQGLYLAMKHKKVHAAVLNQLPAAQLKACWLGAGGPGASGFLQYPEDDSCRMEDAHWSTALRLRLGLPKAECSLKELELPPMFCVQCGAALDDWGYHSGQCQQGGGVMRRHCRCAAAVGSLIQRWLLQKPAYEQRVPAWDRHRPAPAAGEDPIERAVLDIEYTEGSSRRWIDVSVRHPAAGSASVVAVAAKRPGEASRRGEREKHARYPGEQLTAFIVESGGRLGGQACQWLRQQVQQLPADIRVAELSRAYKVISCSVQASVARQMRAARGLK